MKTKYFAAIDVGSYELSCKIFQFSSKGGMKEIDHVMHRLDLGSESFANNSINSPAVRNSLCSICGVLCQLWYMALGLSIREVL